MRKPDNAEIKAAIVAAKQYMGENRASDPVARYLLYLHERNQKLEPIVELVDRYLRFGQPESEHAAMVRMLEELNVLTREEQGDDTGDFGL